jgi:superfamily II DNA helicase RecQ
MPTSREIAQCAVITVDRKYEPLIEALTTRIAELEKKVAELSAVPRVETSPRNDSLYNALREKRMAIATEMGIPAYCVATNKMLNAIVERKPKTEADLRTIYGFGPNKVKLYGETLLKVVADWS